jgi:hypothetical protein
MSIFDSDLASQRAEAEATPVKPRPQHVMPDGLIAPQLLVRYKCPYSTKPELIAEQHCEVERVLDAYSGPPRCQGQSSNKHVPRFMTAVELVGEQFRG